MINKYENEIMLAKEMFDSLYKYIYLFCSTREELPDSKKKKQAINRAASIKKGKNHLTQPEIEKLYNLYNDYLAHKAMIKERKRLNSKPLKIQLKQNIIK
jgi:hypothetical protein